MFIQYYDLSIFHIIETSMLFIILSMQSELMVEVILQKTSWEVYKQHLANFLGVMKKLLRYARSLIFCYQLANYYYYY